MLDVSAQTLVLVTGFLVKDRAVEGKVPVGRTEERRLETFLQMQPRGPLRKAPVVEDAVAGCTGRRMITAKGSSARSSIGCMYRNFLLRGSSGVELQFTEGILMRMRVGTKMKS
jgi:hypothetical protein